MTLKTLISMAVAAAFAVPVAVLAQQSGSTMQPKDSNPAAPPAVLGPSSTDKSTTTPSTTAPARPAGSAASGSSTGPASPAVTGGSNAADRKPNSPKAFTDLDKNNDGYISRDEARDATWDARFSELDKDNDNRLSRSEYDAMQAATGATRAPVTGNTGATGAADRRPNTPKQ
jgi:hypothetical protein